MLTAYILPDLATVPDGFDLAAELAARGFPAREIGTYCGVRERDYITPGWDFEEDGGDALVWNPNTHEVWYLSRGDVEAIQRTNPGTPFTHLCYSYYILTENISHDVEALRREGLACHRWTTHVNVLNADRDEDNYAYPGDMIVYADGALCEVTPKEVLEAIKLAS